MAVLESVQVKVGLTRDPKILKQLKVNRAIRSDEQGEFVPLQFDAQEFRFRKGRTFTVGKTVANALKRSSGVIVGDDPLSDPFMPFVEFYKEFTLGEEDVNANTGKGAKFACDLCGEDCETGPRLARHMMKKHKDAVDSIEELDAPIVPKEPRVKKQLDYNTPIDEQLAKEADGADEVDEG